MTTRPQYVQRATWFPTSASVSCTPPPLGTPLATNGFLPALLTAEDRAALRDMNVRLTWLAMQQCAAEVGVRNQIDFGTQICLALAAFEAHGVSGNDLCDLGCEHDVVFPWS